MMKSEKISNIPDLKKILKQFFSSKSKFIYVPMQKQTDTPNVRKALQCIFFTNKVFRLYNAQL